MRQSSGSASRPPDIKGHRFAYTELGADDDDQPEARTGTQMLDRIVMLLGGQAAEILLITATDASFYDLHSATVLSLTRINCGLDPRAPYLSIEGLSTSRPP